MSEGRGRRCPSVSPFNWVVISRHGPHSHGVVSRIQVLLVPSGRNQVPAASFLSCSLNLLPPLGTSLSSRKNSAPKSLCMAWTAEEDQSWCKGIWTPGGGVASAPSLDCRGIPRGAAVNVQEFRGPGREQSLKGQEF